MELERGEDVLNDVAAEEDWEVEGEDPDGEDDHDHSVCKQQPTWSTCYVKEFDRVVSGDYLLTQNSVERESGSEIRASDQTETAVDSAVVATLNELRDESEDYNIVDRDGSESDTVQVADGAEESDREAGCQSDQSDSIAESDVVSLASGFATEVNCERQVPGAVQPW
ncbi:hypothetical protein DVH05_022512 [Phytophthora capsici]|nr:hypothetical protein DVH05_022512 [Phytophthora capsici]